VPEKSATANQHSFGFDERPIALKADWLFHSIDGCNKNETEPNPVRQATAFSKSDNWILIPKPVRQPNSFLKTLS
jgi:hypothetical protein